MTVMTIENKKYPTGNIKWEMFIDGCYWDMWCVRPVGSKDFNDPRSFHVDTEAEASVLMASLSNATCAVPSTPRS